MDYKNVIISRCSDPLCVEEANRLCWQQFIIFSQKSTWAARAPLAFASTVQRMKKVKAVFVFFPPQKQASPEELRPIQIRIYCICLQKRHSSYRKQALSRSSCLPNHLLSKLPAIFCSKANEHELERFYLLQIIGIIVSYFISFKLFDITFHCSA